MPVVTRSMGRALNAAFDAAASVPALSSRIAAYDGPRVIKLIFRNPNDKRICKVSVLKWPYKITRNRQPILHQEGINHQNPVIKQEDDHESQPVIKQEEIDNNEPAIKREGENDDDTQPFIKQEEDDDPWPA